MIKGMLGKKIGMTQFFDEEGDRVSVTILEAGPCTVQAVKTAEKDGYNAVQLGFDETKEKSIKKPQREYLKKKKLAPKRFVKEIRCSEEPDVKVGDELTISSVFQKGDYLDIMGTSKGKGFQGGVKRHGWAGGGASHGSMFHRAPGSMGASSYPSRVVKGHSLPGHMGSSKVTVQNIEVIEVDKENNTVTVKGAVPGVADSYLVIRHAKKKKIASRVEPEEKEEAEQQEKQAPEEKVQEKEEKKSESKKEEAPQVSEEKAAGNEQVKEEKAEKKSEGKDDKKE